MEPEKTLSKHLQDPLARYIALQIELKTLRETHPYLDRLIKAIEGDGDWQELREAYS